MNKKFLSAILFGALMITSTGTFVSCKDYDDDIDQINQELADLESQIAALQNKVNSGEWVSGVTSTANGVTITLGNGQTFNVTNGEDGANGAAGQNGKDGATPKIAVNDEVIQVSYDDGATWPEKIVLQTPYSIYPDIHIDDKGTIYIIHCENPYNDMEILFGCAAYTLLLVMVIIITIGIIRDHPISEIRRLIRELDEERRCE